MPRTIPGNALHLPLTHSLHKLLHTHSHTQTRTHTHTHTAGATHHPGKRTASAPDSQSARLAQAELACTELTRVGGGGSPNADGQGGGSGVYLWAYLCVYFCVCAFVWAYVWI